MAESFDVLSIQNKMYQILFKQSIIKLLDAPKIQISTVYTSILVNY